MTPAAEKHLEEAATFIAVAESGDAKQAAYRRAAEEIEAAIRADSALTKRAAAARVGKDENWVRRLLKALAIARDGGEFRIDWERGDRDRAGAEKVARERPEAFVAAYQQAPPKVQRQIAKQVAADPFVQQEVSRHNAQERKRQAEEANRQRDAGAVPLPAYMARMVVKINEWALALSAITDEDLEQLPDGQQRELVASSNQSLLEQCRRWDRVLGRRPTLEVIEGQGRRTA